MHNKIVYGVLSVSLLFLAACTSSEQWVRAGSTRQEFDNEEYQCSTLSRSVITRNSLPEDVCSSFKSCMMAHGWQLVKTEDIEKFKALSPAKKEYRAQVAAIMADYKKTIDACNQTMLNRGAFNASSLTNCYNRDVADIFRRHHFDRMDLVDRLKQRDREIAAMLDKKELSLQEGQLLHVKFLVDLFQSADPA